ncbi:MAG: type I polyketide synthase [Microcystis panniformis Mp_MB_F_20051200_S9]|uniref:Type I polyketide synthase n=1 Tax=Microcystis panniformis Mp_MB_F_20051200_S9 TaxID=2486223 RepID=A0A552PRT3_9CHRO|nr:MAG: type I polyketide synthase [Microcystis panniformis Mp_MB_F_20080800_S26D]TRV47807.1 MAG: type I polyketide synthase [Microcystis panniformis Mp_GB_SS_20050300_S99]TRV53190.1 MAG: type I polyketide synthase [Microcystis panniformis Mp_GB_SS_20050300_S99D]TRV59611.1 MAG: type I polyketide synthase [Microcystis panniformis Mp_MB_F_20051200_S9]TRV64267.1 MAG: type I polyketide synthase [Microcystis panniformis Mp_MB_F_20080800_S26]TRV67546.1 MAG: type I polyketide synthase [Microcystis pa
MPKTQSDKIAHPIAVIGMGCHYPGAKQLSELWENILARRCQFRQFPDQRLPLSEYYDPDPATPDKTYGTRGAFIDGFQFDWINRRVPKKTVDGTDIVHWLALEVADKAIEDAGYRRDTIPTQKTGVILGNSLTGEHTRSNVMRLRWPYVRRALRAAAEVKGLSGKIVEELLETMEKFYKSVFPPITEDTLAGGLSNTIAGRICNFFNFDGGGYTVDGACSSSLIAVVTAANALSNGDLDMALAGGIDISLDTFELIGFAKTGALTAQDMKVYDRRASGFVPGEGCGFVVLKRLEDARKAGDFVYAILKGWGISSDGKGGITAPSKFGQSKALLRAYQKAGYSPHTLHFIEGHGTGTPVGDRTELEGIALAMAAEGEIAPRSCGVTSFKSLVGHTKAAAGIGGLIKAVMAVNQRIVPPTVGCKEPNPIFETTALCLYPILQGEIYQPTAILKAGVSAMGFGGINSHVTLVSGDVPATHLKPSLDERSLLVSQQDSEILVFGANSIYQILKSLEFIREKAKGMSLAEMVDLAAQNSQELLAQTSVRAAIIAETPQELLLRLEELIHLLHSQPPAIGETYMSPMKDVWLAHQVKRSRVAFLFPGQGSQKLNMARTLVERYAWARELVQQADLWLIESGFEPISSLIYRPLDRAVNQQQVEQWFKALTDVAPQAICLTSLLWKHYLKRLGLEPVALGGHSLGELTAFEAAGAYDEKTLLCFAAMRGKAMTVKGDSIGTMASLACSDATAQKLLQGISGYVTVANINSPKQTVISGEKASVTAVCERALVQEIQVRQLPVANAFHSQMVASAAEYVRQKAQIPLLFEQPSTSLFTSVNGQIVNSGLNLKEHFADQIVAQVNFVSLVENLKNKCDLIVEVGSGKVLSGLVEATDTSVLCFPLESKPGIARDLNTFLAAYFVQGGEVNWQALYEQRLVRPFVPAAERLFVDNPCERSFPVSLEEIESSSSFSWGEIQQSSPNLSLAHSSNFSQPESFVADDELTTVLANYLLERGSFLSELISADIQSLPFVNTHNP